VETVPYSQEKHYGQDTGKHIEGKAYYQAFWRVLIDLIVELLGLIINPFDNQTES
jgi:hypothetical protein